MVGVSSKKGGVMGACRKTMSLWHYAKKAFTYRSPYWTRWDSFKEFLRLRVDNKYFWHDSFGQYLNRWFVCPFFGHRSLQYLSDGGCSCDAPHWHCFACEKSLSDKPPHTPPHPLMGKGRSEWWKTRN